MMTSGLPNFDVNTIVRKCGGKTQATVQLGMSSTLSLCHDLEGTMMMLVLEASPLPLPLVGCEEFTMKELSRLTNEFVKERKIESGSLRVSVPRCIVGNRSQPPRRCCHRRLTLMCLGAGRSFVLFFYETYMWVPC